MLLYDDTITSYYVRQKNKYKINIEQNKLNEIKILEKLKEGICVNNKKYYSIDEAKNDLKKLKGKKGDINKIVMDQNKINLQCKQLSISFDEIIHSYQSQITKINVDIYNLKEAFSPIKLS